jgi:hypothetical protein
MNPSFREILELLNKHEVEYIVVGGVAAVIQGAPITTFDLDALASTSSTPTTESINLRSSPPGKISWRVGIYCS